MYEEIVKQLRHYGARYASGNTLGREIEGTGEIVTQAAIAIEKLQSELERVKAERDKAVRDIERHLKGLDTHDCDMCIYRGNCRRSSAECESEAKWRGVEAQK